MPGRLRIDAQVKAFSLNELCDILGVSIGGYRAWKRGGTPDRKRLADIQMLAMIRAIHAEVKGAYGSPRMVRELRLRGHSARKRRVERLMRTHGIHARHKQRYRVTTESKHGLPVARICLTAISHRRWLETKVTQSLLAPRTTGTLRIRGST